MSTSSRNASKIKMRRSRSRSRSLSPTRSRSPPKTTLMSRRLLVSNIPFTTTFNDLKNIFKDNIGICGKLEFIEKNGKFTGNASMEFKTLDGAQKAVDKMHKFVINGREIIVREETHKDRERLNLNNNQSNSSLPSIQSQTSISQLISEIEKEGPITNSLFIANLDYNLTWQKLKDLFKAAGRVRHVDLKMDSEGKSRGFGTVEFETPEEAILAIHMFNNKFISNREMKLRMDKSGKPLVGRLDLTNYVGNDSQGLSNNLNPELKRVVEDILVAAANPSRTNPQISKALDELINLAKVFERPTIQPQPFQNMPILNDDRNFGFTGVLPSRGWNDMPNYGSESYIPAQNYDLSYFNGRGPMINANSSNSFNEYGNKPREYPPGSARETTNYSESSRNSGQNNGFDMGIVEDMLFKMKNSGNLDQSTLMNVISNVFKRNDDSYQGSVSNNYDNPRPSDDFTSVRPSATLLIKNIPFSYSWKDLKISFSQVAGIKQIEILRDDYKRSKGIGLVRFESPSDAVRCKNMMDGTLLDGRPIHIEFKNSF